MLKKFFLFSITILTIWSCNSPVKEQQNSQKTDSSSVVQKDTLSSKIEVKDRSLYHTDFIKGLVHYNETVKLADNYIITGRDTTYFPEDLPLQKKVIFKGKNDHFSITLSLIRTNLTDLKYHLEYTRLLDQKYFNQSGTAILGSMFFLASEMDEDAETGEGYASAEYWDQSKKCTLAIRIELGKNDDRRQRAMLKYDCADQRVPKINLEDCPLLKTE